MKFNFTTGKFMLILIFLSAIGYGIFIYSTHTYIRAEFQHLDPFPAKMPVYYKGYKLGTTSKNEISKDFTKTILYIRLKQRGLHLPRNITAEIKKQSGSYYVELVFPEKPAKKYIRSGDLIKGKTYSEIEATRKLNQAYLVSLAEKGDNLLNSATKLSENADKLILLLNDVIDENRDDLKATTKNLKTTTENLSIITTEVKDLAQKANSSINPQELKASSKNIKLITDDLTQITSNLIPITKNLTDTTSNLLLGLPKLDNLIDKLTGVVVNLNEILQGIKCTLKQRFSGFRIMFGKAIK